MKNSAIHFLCETAIKYPDKTCICDEAESFSFSKLILCAHQLSEIIKTDKHINRPIPVYLPKGSRAVVSFAGILMSGNFYAPLDINSPSHRIQKILNNLEPSLIISKREYKSDLDAINKTASKIIYWDDIELAENNGDLDGIVEQIQFYLEFVIDTDPCYVMHTSGSTGVPKGVVIPHRGVIDYIEWAVKCLDVGPNEIIGNQAPFYFDNSTLDIYLSWATGSKLDLIPESHFIFSAKLVEYMDNKKISFIFFVPTVLINISKLKLLKKGMLPSLKKIVFAGEVMPAKHLSYWQDNLPDRLYANLYGPTEITVDCTYFIVDRKYAANESLPIGFPCQNSGILILNENDEKTKVGEHGELCVRGSSLALGYWKNDEKTQEVFTRNPLQKNYFDRIYRTGDIVYLNEKNQIIYVGRKDSQIKHLGNRIELGEIETAILAIPKIENCCALYNGTKQEITLFYECNEEQSAKDFMNFLSKNLPRYMVPRKYVYFDKLPLNQNGKINRTLLKNEYL